MNQLQASHQNAEFGNRKSHLCRVCKRPLRNPRSLVVRMGMVCAKKFPGMFERLKNEAEGQQSFFPESEGESITSLFGASHAKAVPIQDSGETNPGPEKQLSSFLQFVAKKHPLIAMCLNSSQKANLYANPKENAMKVIFLFKSNDRFQMEQLQTKSNTETLIGLFREYCHGQCLPNIEFAFEVLR